MAQPERRPRMVSSSEDPERAAALAQEILGESTEKDEHEGMVAVPFIPTPPDVMVRLPGGGVRGPDGVFQDEAEVRELTGEDEEALSKIDPVKNYGRYVQTLVRRGTVRLGGVTEVTDDLLGELLVGDREMLTLAIRRATYGDELKVNLACPSCVSAVEATYDLATEIPISRLDDPSQRQIDVGLRRGRKAVVSIPTAADQDACLALSGKTRSEINSMLLGRCLVTIDGMAAQSVAVAKNLGMQDREVLLEALMSVQPGPRYEEVMVGCPGCNEEFPLRLGLLDLFRS